MEHHDIDFQKFLDMLQRAGEEAGVMDIEDEDLDNHAPLDVILQFIESLLFGMRNVAR